MRGPLQSTSTNKEEEVIDLDDDDSSSGCYVGIEEARLKEELSLVTIILIEEDKEGGVEVPTTGDCPICMDNNIPIEDGMRLSCNHFMCLPCARAYIKDRIQHGQVNNTRWWVRIPGRI